MKNNNISLDRQLYWTLQGKEAMIEEDDTLIDKKYWYEVVRKSSSVPFLTKLYRLSHDLDVETGESIWLSFPMEYARVLKKEQAREEKREARRRLVLSAADRMTFRLIPQIHNALVAEGGTV